MTALENKLLDDVDRLQDKITTLEAIVAKLEDGLNYCKRVTYGTELINTQEENNEIIARHFFNSQEKARSVLEEVQAMKEKLK